MFTVSAPVSTSQPKISPKGSPSERLWIIADNPLPRDKDKGFLFSSPMGWSFDKMLGEVGIRNYYVDCVDHSDSAGTDALYQKLNNYQPPFICLLDGSGRLLPQIKKIEDVNLWAGSLLTSDKLSYPHYMIPTFGPETCVKDWTERQIVKYIDFGKIKDELEYYHTNGSLQPLLGRQLNTNIEYNALLYLLNSWLDDSKYPYISVDIETVYPREKSDYFGHPGYPVVVGIGTSATHGCSFPLFWEEQGRSIKVWKALGKLLQAKAIIGQNYDHFDDWILGMLGMPIDRMKLHDTRLRHAVLWPELSHSLQFMTRQYTRQPYYKSEGHHWNLKDLDKLKRYNALDCAVTYQVFEAQEKEFNERPHLR